MHDSLRYINSLTYLFTYLLSAEFRVIIANLQYTIVLVDTEAVIAALKDAGKYEDDVLNRIRAVLLAPHKHKGREALKTKQPGTNTSILGLSYCQK